MNQSKVFLVITDSATTLSPFWQDSAAGTVAPQVLHLPDIEEIFTPHNRAERRGHRHGAGDWNKNRNKKGGKR